MGRSQFRPFAWLLRWYSNSKIDAEEPCSVDTCGCVRTVSHLHRIEMCDLFNSLMGLSPAYTKYISCLRDKRGQLPKMRGLFHGIDLKYLTGREACVHGVMHADADTSEGRLGPLVRRAVY